MELDGPGNSLKRWASPTFRPLLLAAVSLLVLGACGTRRPLIVERLAAAEEDELFPRDRLFPSVAVATWHPASAPAPSARDSNPPLFEAQIDRDARTIQTAEIVVDGVDAGTVKLFWEGDAPSEGEPAHAALQIEHFPRIDGTLLPFQLSAEPAWNGRIRRIWVMADRRARPQLRVRSISLMARQAAGPAESWWTNRSWRISLGNDQRRAFVGLPRAPLNRPIELGPATRLRFEYGLEAGVRVPTRFRVVARASGDPPRIVFDETIEADQELPAWHSAEVSLDAFRGKCELSFEVEGGAEFDPKVGLAFWADPLLSQESARQAPPNLVLFSADTLRADRLGSYGSRSARTPALDRWFAERGALFRDAIAAAPSTLPAHASMFTGLDPPRHGANGGPAASDLLMLAERLRAAGYRTIAVTGGGYLHPSYGLDQGFDVFRHWRWGHERERELPENVDWVLGQLGRLPEPFFLFLHTYETHSPYRARTPYYTEISGRAAPPEMLYPVPNESSAEEGFLYRLPAKYEFRGADPSAGATGIGDAALASDLYDSSVAFVDEQFDRVLNALAHHGRDRRSVVVFTSDHGESLGDHGLAGHGTLFEENLRVPLMISGPGISGGRRINRQARAVDLVPTLLDLLGLPQAPGLAGRSLVPLLRGGDLPPLPALSYAGNSNRGLSLRFERGVKMLAQDTPWAPLAGLRQWIDLRGDPSEDAILPLAGSSRAALEEWLEDRLVGPWRGGTLRWRSASGEALRLRLTGVGLTPTAAKLVGPPGENLRYLEPGGLEGTLSAGSAGQVLVAPEACRALVAEARSGVGPWLRLELSCPGAAETWSASEGVWQRSLRASQGAQIEWSARSGAELPAHSARDPLLVEQLRALGYLP